MKEGWKEEGVKIEEERDLGVGEGTRWERHGRKENVEKKRKRGSRRWSTSGRRREKKREERRIRS